MYLYFQPKNTICYHNAKTCQNSAAYEGICVGGGGTTFFVPPPLKNPFFEKILILF